MARGLRSSEERLATRAKSAGLTRYDYQTLRTAAVRKSAAKHQWSMSERATSIAEIVMIAEKVFGPWTHRVERANPFNYLCLANGKAYTAILQNGRFNIHCNGQPVGVCETVTDFETFVNHDAGDVEQGRETANAPHVEPSISEPEAPAVQPVRTSEMAGGYDDAMARGGEPD